MRTQRRLLKRRKIQIEFEGERYRINYTPQRFLDSLNRNQIDLDNEDVQANPLVLVLVDAIDSWDILDSTG